MLAAPAAGPAPAMKAKKPAKAAASAKAATPQTVQVAPPAADVLAGMGEEGFDPRPALEQVALGLLEPSPAQMKALIALMPYVHTKRGEGGKKEQRQEAAQKVAGRFAPAARHSTARRR